MSAVGYGSGLPPNGEYFRMSFTLNNSANPGGAAAHRDVGAGQPGLFFRTLEIPLMRGRFFIDADGPNAPPVGIINRVAARQFLGDDDPIGQSLPFASAAITIVGVVDNVKYTGIASGGEGVVYRPYAQIAAPASWCWWQRQRGIQLASRPTCEA